MPDPRDEHGNNPAQIRGDISRNQADKRPGVDPAAAPLETDAEAGGNAFSEADVATARETQREGAPPGSDLKPEELSYGTAMRPVDPAPQTPGARKRLAILLAIVVVAIGILVALL